MKVSRLPYEGNMYPVTNYAFIQDEQAGTRFSILVDRSHGFTSTKSGQLEAIFDRRLPYDDARGMDEGVNDPEDMVSNYVLLLEPLLKVQGDKAWAPTLEVQRASKFLNFQPTAFVYDSIASDNKNMHPRIALFTRQFPADMFLLNMRTAPGTSRGVPSKRALMLLQNLGHLKNTGVNVENSMVLNADLRVNHFAVATDLTGSSLSDEQDLDSAHSLRTAFIPKGNPYEINAYALHFLNFIENIK
ncbi:Alpha-mannosidase 2 [Orchesella cincta]|uniref:Alpha-mannosidase 2 n=1 Tax=Orchesella cincta TaxID=48709 RepID=A0A1D2MMW9_ORCCI|nr:Alpha-mannosidase 2 [Orchesella cincta]